MSDDIEETQEEEGGFSEPSELDLLKERADLMGITYHPSIGPEKLKAKINAALNEPEEKPAPVVAAPAAPAVKVKPLNERQMKLREAQKLARVRITCMNPNKREQDGEIFTFGNRAIKTYRKYLPYNVPWMVPMFMVNMIRNKKVQLFRTVKRGDQKVREGYQIPEYSVEMLPGPTQSELDRLATKQAAQQALDDN